MNIITLHPICTLVRRTILATALLGASAGALALDSGARSTHPNSIVGLWDTLTSPPVPTPVARRHSTAAA